MQQKGIEVGFFPGCGERKGETTKGGNVGEVPSCGYTVVGENGHKSGFLRRAEKKIERRNSRSVEDSTRRMGI